ncbi:MAG TPA: potassium transporter Kef [Polyangiaceae bacterium]|nr:potassium transporter Kef [Polyangiaceae bacterium]
MSDGIWLLLGLLLLAYLGSNLVGGRAIRGFGLPSGSEYLVLGFALGPHVFDVVARSLWRAFEPVVLVGTGWLSLVVAVGYTRVANRWLQPARAAVGVLLGALTCLLVAGVAYWLAPLLGGFQGPNRLSLAIGMGACASATTRHSVRWVVERHGASGPLADFAADAARASALVPPLALATLFALAPGSALPTVPALGRLMITLAFGSGLGLIAALLLGRDFRRDESWGVLLGTGLLCLGAADRAGLSLLGAMFAMGLTLAMSRHRLDIKAMLTPTEKPVLLPVVLLAGAYVNLRLPTPVFGLVGVLVVVKLLARVLLGLLLGLGPARGTGADFGLSMLASGGFTIACALAMSTRMPGVATDAVLLFAVVSNILGEWLSPGALRRSLERAGELHAVGEDELGRPSDAPESLSTRESHG